MPVEGIERARAEYRISKGGSLLEKIALCKLAAGAIPRSPFIDHQLHLMFRIKLAHSLPVTLNQRFYAVPFAQYLVPILNIELKRVALRLIPILGVSPA